MLDGRVAKDFLAYTFRLVVLLWVVPLWVIACASAPPAGGEIVTAVDIRGGLTSEHSELRKGLATQPDEVLDADALNKDLERVRRFYRGLGYYEAKIQLSDVARQKNQRVRVEIEIDAGPPVRVSELASSGFEGLPPKAAMRARALIRLRVGQPIAEARLHGDARAVEEELTASGFPFAKVSESATVSLSERSARVEYRLSPGPQAEFGEITIEGLKSIDEQAVRRNTRITKGQPYSQRDIERTRVRLVELGVFSEVEIVPDLGHPETRKVPVRIVVREGASRSLHVGATASQDSVRTLIGARVGWENRNFFGGLRLFSITTTPAVILYPLGVSDVELKALPTLANMLRLEQPAALGPNTTAFVQADLNFYPVLYPDFSPGDNIIGFRELKGTVGVERTTGKRPLRFRPSYTAQASLPFMYLGERPEGLDNVIVLFPEIVVEADLRDNPVEPRSGAFFQLSTQLAGFLLGDASDLRIRPEVRLYAKLSSTFSLGSRTTFGLLFPRRCGDDPSRGCYGDSLSASLGSNVSAETTRDQQILLLRAFYSGGATSNRGYNLREVGPHGELGYLVPASTDCTVADPPSQCIRPLGGLTLWEQSLEARWTPSKLFGVVFFIDASDITRETLGFRATYPHLSAGSGLRLRTPIGAARLDFGVRVPYAQHIGHSSLPPEEGDPQEVLGAPMAIHFGLGEAF